MQRLRLALLLPLLLVLAQHGAVLHELSHIYYSGSPALGAQLQQDGRVAESTQCTACLAFAQVANPAAASVAHLRAPASASLSLPEPRYSIVAACQPTPRSRGPPPSLS